MRRRGGAGGQSMQINSPTLLPVLSALYLPSFGIAEVLYGAELQMNKPDDKYEVCSYTKLVEE